MLANCGTTKSAKLTLKEEEEEEEAKEGKQLV